jgi:hypothetical protein
MIADRRACGVAILLQELFSQQLGSAKGTWLNAALRLTVPRTPAADPRRR